MGKEGRDTPRPTTTHRKVDHQVKLLGGARETGLGGEGEKLSVEREKEMVDWRGKNKAEMELCEAWEMTLGEREHDEMREGRKKWLTWRRKNKAEMEP